MEKLNVPEFSFCRLPFVFEYATHDGGIYQQKAYSYTFENNYLTFLCEVCHTSDKGEMSHYMTAFFSVSNVKTVRLVHEYFDKSSREVKAPTPPAPPAPQAPIVIQISQQNDTANTIPTQTSTSETVANEPVASEQGKDEIRQPENQGSSKPKIKLDLASVQQEFASADNDEVAQMPKTPTQDFTSPLSILEDDDNEAASAVNFDDTSGISGEEWAISKVGHDVKQQKYDLFIQGLGAFIKEHENVRPLPFDLVSFTQEMENKGLTMGSLSHKDVKEWVCQFIAESEKPQIWFDEADERIFNNIHHPIIEVGTKHFFNPIIMQEILAQSDDENIKSIVINNPNTFTTFKIAAYLKYKKVK